MYFQNTEQIKQKLGTEKDVAKADPDISMYHDYFLVQPEVEVKEVEITDLAETDDQPTETRYPPKETQRICAICENDKFKVGDNVVFLNSNNPVTEIMHEGVLYFAFRITSIIAKV